MSLITLHGHILHPQNHLSNRSSHGKISPSVKLLTQSRGGNFRLISACADLYVGPPECARSRTGHLDRYWPCGSGRSLQRLAPYLDLQETPPPCCAWGEHYGCSEARAGADWGVARRRREISWARDTSAVRARTPVTRSRWRREAVTGRRPGREMYGPTPCPRRPDRMGRGTMNFRRLTISLPMVDNNGALG